MAILTATGLMLALSGAIWLVTRPPMAALVRIPLRGQRRR